MTRGPVKRWPPMRYSELGGTGLRVSVLCFGTLALGRAQYNLLPQEASRVLLKAWELGVNFFDTAEIYGTYGHLKVVAGLPGAVIASRSYASTAHEMQASFDLCRRELRRETLDVFGLHEQESGLTLKGHREALSRLATLKQKGVLKAVSVSTHFVSCVKAAAMLDEVDVIFALLNVDGLGIRDGTRQDMEAALAFARQMGKGIYLMKALGGGHLFRDPRRALEYARDFPHKDSVAVGLKDEYEVEFAAGVLSGEGFPDIAKAGRIEAERRLTVEEWCEGCGRCVAVCPFRALTVECGKAKVDPERCMLCGYCARACPHFCLKVV